MSNDHDRSDLPKPVEALLADWPSPERAALDWEQSSEATLSRVKETAIGSTTDSLLSAPLPAEPGEPGEWSLRTTTIDSVPEDAPGLAQIARAAVESEPVLDPELDAVAKETLSIASRGRPNLAASRPAARPAAADVAPPQGRVTPEPPADGALPKPAAVPERRRERVWIAASAALAIAAVAIVYLKSSSTRDEPAATLPVSTSVPEAKLSTPAPAPTKEPATPENTPVVPLKELPKKQATVASSSSRSASAGSAARKEAASAAESAPAANGELPEDTQMRPAAQDMAVAAKPSIGEVQGAFGTVMPAARQCLAGQESGAQVAVTFGSDGRVQQVKVAGAAAGTPAESCLSAAFRRARLAPFSEPDFTAKITVRPP